MPNLDIQEKITLAIWEKRETNFEPKCIYIGRHDYYDLKKNLEPYMVCTTIECETEKYGGLELIVVDRERYLDVGI